MATTYRHARLHAERAVHHLSLLVSDLGHPEPSDLHHDLRVQVNIGGAPVTLAASPTGGDRGSIVIEAPDHETLSQVEKTVETQLRDRVGSDRLSLAWSDPVRPATLADDQALLDLDRRSWDDTSAIPSAQDLEVTRFFRPGGRSPNGLLLAERDGALIGMVKVHPKSPFPESAHVFAVVNLVVAPERRRQGVATMLLTVAEHVARSNGARKLSLMVRGANLPAIQLYTDHGYQVEGRFANELLINGRYVDDLSLGKAIAP